MCKIKDYIEQHPFEGLGDEPDFEETHQGRTYLEEQEAIINLTKALRIKNND